MAKRIIYIPNRVIDSDGVSDGSTFTVYRTGTTTLVSIYTNNALTNPMPNPFTVPAGAEVPQFYHNETEDIRLLVTFSDGSTDDNDPYDAFATVSDLTASSGAVTLPDQDDYPRSIYVGDVNVDALVAGGLGNNVLVGQNLLSSSFTGTDAVNPDTGYGLTYIGTSIGTQNQTNCRDNEIVGYEAAFYLGNCNQMQILGAKALYCDLTRGVTPNTGAPSAGVAIGTTAHYDGLTFTSTRFVSIGTNVGREMTRNFEGVYVGAQASRYLGDTLYQTVVGANAAGGLVDNGATNTTHTCSFGWQSLGNLKNGTQNTVVGSNAGLGIQDGGRNVIIGAGAGSDITAITDTSAGPNGLINGSFNTLIGNETEVSSPTASYQAAIGAGAAATKNNQTVIGDTGRDHEVLANGYFKSKVFTVSTLPNAATSGAGSRAFVSDTTLTASGNFAASTSGTGGGSNFAPVYSDGSAWRIG